MKDWQAETKEAIGVYLSDPTPLVEVAVRNHILYLGKSSPGELFALHRELVSEWGRVPPRWSGEDAGRRVVLALIAGTVESEKLCHMCEGGRFAHVNTVGEGTNMEVRHYRCVNPACGVYDAVIVHPA